MLQDPDGYETDDSNLLESISIEHLQTELQDDLLHHMLRLWEMDINFTGRIYDNVDALELLSLPFQGEVVEIYFSMKEPEDVTNTLIPSPTLELKPLPSKYKYIHLDVEGYHPIIISSNLTTKNKNMLI